MTAVLTRLSEELDALLAAGRVVRIGEASVVGRAVICPDERRMDLVTVTGSLPETSLGTSGGTQPIALWVCHYPGEVDPAGLTDALDAGLRAYSVTRGGEVPPHLPIYANCPVLPDFGTSVSLVRRCHAIHIELSLPPEHLALVYFLVSALESRLWDSGIPPRQIRRIRRLTGANSASRTRTRLLLPAFLTALFRRDGRAGLPAPSAARSRSTAGPGDHVRCDASDSSSRIPRKERRWRGLLSPPAAPRPLPAPNGRQRRINTVSHPRRVVRPGHASRSPGELDLPGTVARAALRGPTGPGRVSGLHIREDDLAFRTVPERVEVDRCLLLDASASMAGYRTKACSAMADFFLRNSRGRLALVAFRGDQAKVLSGFTRSRRQLQVALRLLRPSGLTPLASGLMLSLGLVERARARRPQVILVTDGEPTRSLWTRSALADALTAAKLFKESGVRLVCCGVAGNEEQLAALARCSGGRLFVLRDFSEDSLLGVTRHVLG